MDKEMENRKQEYNIGEYLHYPGIRKYILKKTQTTLTLKEKPEKLYYIKLGTSIYHKTPLGVKNSSSQAGRRYLQYL